MSTEQEHDDDFMYDKLNELMEYARLEGSELGELCELLEQLFSYRSYMLNETLYDALNEEILKQLDNFKTYAKIVKTKETVEREVVGLEWY